MASVLGELAKIPPNPAITVITTISGVIVMGVTYFELIISMMTIACEWFGQPAAVQPVRPRTDGPATPTRLPDLEFHTDLRANA